MKPMYVSPFNPLNLSADEKAELQHTAMGIVDGVQASFEDFLWKDHGKMDPGLWTLIRQREDLRAYEDRRQGAGTGNKDMHLVVVTGTMPGQLNDVMYGALNPTAEAMRIKTTYVHDTLIDSAVLDPILMPTREQPYQSMSVRWFVKGVPLHVRAISKHRDNVYLEATGIRLLSNGERYGYHLKHSVAFEKTPLLPQYDRFNMSFCTVWRQATHDRVQAYTVCYIEIQDNIFVPLVMKSMADACLSIWRYMVCAQHKKFAWLVRNKELVKNDGERQEGCSVCGVQGRSVKRDLRYACAACAAYTCKKCRVTRQLSIFAPDQQLLRHDLRFCMRCVTFVNGVDAELVALHDVSRRDDPVLWSALRKTMSGYGLVSEAAQRHHSVVSATSISSVDRSTASSGRTVGYL